MQLQCCSAASARADLVPCSALLCSAQLSSAQLSSSHLCSRSVCISAFCSVRLQYKGESQLIARPSPIGTTTARQRAKKQHRVCLALGLGGAWTALHCPKSLQALGPSSGHLATLSRPSSSPLAWVCLCLCLCLCLYCCTVAAVPMAFSFTLVGKPSRATAQREKTLPAGLYWVGGPSPQPHGSARRGPSLSKRRPGCSPLAGVFLVFGEPLKVARTAGSLHAERPLNKWRRVNSGSTSTSRACGDAVRVFLRSPAHSAEEKAALFDSACVTTWSSHSHCLRWV